MPRASVCGLSLGGMVALWLAAHAPDRVHRLAVCCSAWLGPPEAGRAGGHRARQRTGAVADAVLARWFHPGFVRRNPDLADRMRTMIAATPAEGYAGCCEARSSAWTPNRRSALWAPTLVIAGADDPATPPEHAARIADGVTGAGSWSSTTPRTWPTSSRPTP